MLADLILFVAKFVAKISQNSIRKMTSKNQLIEDDNNLQYLGLGCN